MFRYYLQIHVYRLLKLDISIAEYWRFLLHKFVFILVDIHDFVDHEIFYKFPLVENNGKN